MKGITSAMIAIVLIAMVIGIFIFNQKPLNISLTTTSSTTTTALPCLEEGQSEPGVPTVPRNCCSGLNQSYVYSIVDGNCIPAPGANFICIKCGDGICGSGENKCNCPQDCGSTTTTLDDLARNPALFVVSYIKVQGQVVKNVGAFFGDTYYLQSNEGIRNFKSLNESSTGIAIVSDKINFENYVGYTFNGTGYSISPRRFFYVNVSGYVRDRGIVTDVSRYFLEVDVVSEKQMV
jgi:hypothetical protein